MNFNNMHQNNINQVNNNMLTDDEAEQLLKIKFDTVAVACAGVDDKLYIFTTDEALYGKLAPYLAEKMATHHSAFREKLIPKIPKNSSGKTIYKELEPYYDEV